MSVQTPHQWADGNQNVQISHSSGAVTVTINERFWHPALEPASIPAPPSASPSRLIRARSGIVPFVGRSDVLASLKAWLAGREEFSVYVVGGAGGSGKTRLGVQLCQQTHDDASWVSGFVPPNAEALGLRDLADLPKPRLAVFDYAESRVEQLNSALPLLARTATSAAPVRVLLLIRKAPTAGKSDWTEPLRASATEWLESALDDAQQTVLDASVANGPSERLELYCAAHNAFTKQDGRDPATRTEPDLSDPIFSNALMTVVTAFLDASKGPKLPTTVPDLLDGLLQHEDRYWAKTEGGRDIERDVRPRLVAFAALMGSNTENDGAELLRVLPHLADSPAERRHQLSRWLHNLYPESGSLYWNSVEPDLLAEHLIATQLGQFPQVLAASINPHRGRPITAALSVIARTAGWNAGFAAAVGPVFGKALPQVTLFAVQEANGLDWTSLAQGPTTASALALAVQAIAGHFEPSTAALEVFPERTSIHLAELALAMTKHQVTWLRSRRRQDPEASSALARSLLHFSILLVEAGYPTEAIEAAAEALTIYQPLAVKLPRYIAPQMASCLSCLANAHAAAGNRLDALEFAIQAAETRRTLPNPDQEAHKSGLAASLNNLSNAQAALGDWPGALLSIQEATSIYRSLARARPLAYNPEVAMALINLSNWLKNTGNLVGSQAAIKESVALYRRLARTHPDIYTPNLALSLNNLSNGLAQSGDHRGAVKNISESVRLYRALAEKQPDSFNRHLAMSLNNLGNRLAQIGDVKAGKETARECINIYRFLAVEHPQAFKPHLAGALANLAGALSGADEVEEAIASGHEAVNLFRALSGDEPEVFTPNLALALNNLSNALAVSGDKTAALTAVTEAVAHMRPYAEAQPLAYAPRLATVLSARSFHLNEVGEIAGALDAISEAILVCRNLVHDDSQAFSLVLADCLRMQANVLTRADRHREAEAAHAEAEALITTP